MISYYLILYHIISYFIRLYHIISYYIILYHMWAGSVVVSTNGYRQGGRGSIPLPCWYWVVRAGLLRWGPFWKQGLALESYPHHKNKPTTTRGYDIIPRSEEHTSELQSPCNLVCRLLLEKKNRHMTID